LGLGVASVVWSCSGGYLAHPAHLPVQELPATMLLVLERFFQQSWHTMIQPRVLWLAPRVLIPSPPFPQMVHVPMVGDIGVGGYIFSLVWVGLGKVPKLYMKSSQV